VNFWVLLQNTFNLSTCNTYTGMFISCSVSVQFVLLTWRFLKSLPVLRSSKCVLLDEIRDFIRNCGSEDFIYVHKYIFNLILPHQNFPTLWKQVEVIHMFKRSNSTSVSTGYAVICVTYHTSNVQNNFVLCSIY
jgi:hypothetical protein